MFFLQDLKYTLMQFAGSITEKEQEQSEEGALVRLCKGLLW